LKYKNLFQAIGSEAAVFVLAPALGRPITGTISFSSLYSVDKLGFFHIAGVDTKTFGFLPDLCDFHCF
jgi:hypothetical protein